MWDLSKWVVSENLRLVVERENSFRKEAATIGLSFPSMPCFQKRVRTGKWTILLKANSTYSKRHFINNLNAALY